MKTNLYSIEDRLTSHHMTPFPAQNDDVAKRMAISGAKNKDSLIGANPSDFAVYKLGVYDDNAGTITGEPKPVFICTVAELLLEAPNGN